MAKTTKMLVLLLITAGAFLLLSTPKASAADIEFSVKNTTGTVDVFAFPIAGKKVPEDLEYFAVQAKKDLEYAVLYATYLNALLVIGIREKNQKLQDASFDLLKNFELRSMLMKAPYKKLNSSLYGKFSNLSSGKYLVFCSKKVVLESGNIYYNYNTATVTISGKDVSVEFDFKGYNPSYIK